MTVDEGTMEFCTVMDMELGVGLAPLRLGSEVTGTFVDT